MKHFTIVLCGFMFLAGSFQRFVSGQRPTTERIAPDKGNWGREREWRYCSANKWAIGFRLKVEADVARADDTAMNAMELVCADTKKEGSEFIKEIEGHWGNWGSYTYCPEIGDFLSSVRFKIEPPQGAGIGAQDDTAANDVEFICSKSSSTIKSTNGEKWGDWKRFVSCPYGSAICGFSLIWEDNQAGLDDTAANGALFDCCKLDQPCINGLPCKNGGACSNSTCTCKFPYGVSPEVKYYNIEIELDYYSIIGESTGLCVRPMDGCKFEIQSRRRKREVNFLRKAHPTNQEQKVSQMAEQVCQVYVDEMSKVIGKLNISIDVLTVHYIIEDVITACVFDLQTTGDKELAASIIYVLLSEGMMFLPPMSDTAYTAYWHQGSQLMNEVLIEVQKQIGSLS
ncbi:unnamed protein product [Rotaria sp. Silwood2]|nr:unnamed protein product [Rotaria sp. Silwood2]